jgi:hypothetical protein
MAEPIQQRGSQLLIPKHLDPFAKGEMTRHHGGALAVTFGQNVQKSLPPSALKRHKTAFVHDQQINLHQALLNAP